MAALRRTAASMFQEHMHRGHVAGSMRRASKPASAWPDGHSMQYGRSVFFNEIHRSSFRIAPLLLSYLPEVFRFNEISWPFNCSYIILVLIALGYQSNANLSNWQQKFVGGQPTSYAYLSTSSYL